MKNTGTVVGIVLIVVLAVLLLGGAGMMGFGGFGMMGPGMTLAPHASAGVGGYGGYGGMFGGYGFNPFGAIVGIGFQALVIGGIALLVVSLVRSASSTPTSTPRTTSSDSALEILKARYARGEINKEQFDAIKRDLEA